MKSILPLVKMRGKNSNLLYEIITDETGISPEERNGSEFESEVKCKVQARGDSEVR